MLMTASSADKKPEPDFHIEIPVGAERTENLTGYFPVIGHWRVEIQQRLQSQGITPNVFPEFVTGTRFNLRYMLSISDMLRKSETFRCERVCFACQSRRRRVTNCGDKTAARWASREELDEHDSPSDLGSKRSTTQIGASYVFGFQLYKEDGLGQTLTAQATRSCLWSLQDAEEPWEMPEAWHASRNDRWNISRHRDRRFRGLGKTQDYALQDDVHRMIRMPR
jgi:hypothetical protein